MIEMQEAPRGRAIGSHERPNRGATNVWLTPKWIIDAFKAYGSDEPAFDLDPCAAPEPRPFATAKRHIIEAEDGLSQDWGDSFVWMNPPYGPEVYAWLTKLRKHGNGIALVFARTETPGMQEALRYANARLFMAKRIIFLKPDGTPGRNKKGYVCNSGAPSMLLAYGDRATRALHNVNYDMSIKVVLM